MATQSKKTEGPEGGLPSLFTGFLNNFNKFFDTDWLLPGKWISHTPGANIKEGPDGYDIELAVPGMEKKDFNIDVEKGILKVSAEKEEKEEKEKQLTWREYDYYNFHRVFPLPNSVIPEEIDAFYQNGVLTIKVPKNEEARHAGKKKVEVN